MRSHNSCPQRQFSALAGFVQRLSADNSIEETLRAGQTMIRALIFTGFLLLAGCQGRSAYEEPIEENGGYVSAQDQEVARLRKRLSTLRYLHKKTLRDADRLTFTDLGHSRHLYHHAKWLEVQIEQTEKNLQVKQGSLKR